MLSHTPLVFLLHFHGTFANSAELSLSLQSNHRAAADWLQREQVTACAPRCHKDNGHKGRVRCLIEFYQHKHGIGHEPTGEKLSKSGAVQDSLHAQTEGGRHPYQVCIAELAAEDSDNNRDDYDTDHWDATNGVHVVAIYSDKKWMPRSAPLQQTAQQQPEGEQQQRTGTHIKRQQQQQTGISSSRRSRDSRNYKHTSRNSSSSATD